MYRLIRLDFSIKRIKKLGYFFNEFSGQANLKVDKPKMASLTGSAVLRVLGSGCAGSPKVVYLFTDHCRYLFNCGEGTQRLAHEHKMKIARLEHIFITSADWNCMGGLPGVSLTMQEIGAKHVNLHGPPGVNELFTAMQKFVVLNSMNISMANCDKDTNFEDKTMFVKYIPIRRNDIPESMMKDLKTCEKSAQIENDSDYYGHESSSKRQSKEDELKRLLELPKKDYFITMAYICRLRDRFGTLDLQKCVSKGVKPGPMLGLLKSGQNVTLPDGTVINANDVKTPDEPGALFIVIDIPSVEYLDNLLESEDFKMHQEKTLTNPKDIPDVIVHFTPDDILKTEKYQSFMDSFSASTNHLLINEGNECFNSIAIQRVQEKLHLLDDEMFPCVNYFGETDCQESIKRIQLNTTNDSDIEQQSTIQSDNSKITAATRDNYIRAKTLTTYFLKPKRGLERSYDVKVNRSEYIAEAHASIGFTESLKEFHTTVANLKQNMKSEKYPMIVFFGTGSCIPNKTRNTSGMMLHIDEKNCILLDCGEGTYGQMLRFYGKNEIDNILRDMKAVYISHLHADHHIGLISIIQGRKKALDRLRENGQLDTKQENLFLLAPKQIMTWLHLYDKRFEDISSDFQLLANSLFIRNHDKVFDDELFKTEMINSFLNQTSLRDLETCIVKHCPNAFGVSFITSNGKKITYSGDTMPCERLIKMGMNSDILIHEATMEDELDYEAVKKMHSTTGQAVEVGQKMNTKFTILTHFSQRYARVPRLSSDIEKSLYVNNVGIAFDNMRLTYDSLGVLPYMYSPLKLMFAEHCEEIEARAAKRAMKRSYSPVDRVKEKPLSKPLKMKNKS
ncbi:ribonuclease Z [Arctopsyche grandis]|uniref:ribonuclease Z n=1 Tax=Arctopsyche grandis TaxID=121162 RepID=UPI00406DA31D